MNNQKFIRYNKKIHETKKLNYNIKHKYDIFSIHEQKRLSHFLKKAVSNIKSKNIKAFDLGAGTGNLTNHLLKLAKSVVAADISSFFLDQIEKKFHDKVKSKELATLILNGKDLSNVEDNYFDLVATYAVLHHIPDYLGIVSEMIRITKPGGVIYIDHEVNEDYWNPSNNYIEFLRLTRIHKPKMKDRYKFLRINKYLNKLYSIVHKFNFSTKLPITNPFNPKYQKEGDIHVWKDDHIEWDKIIKLLTDNSCKVLYQKDYLFYKSYYPKDIYNKYNRLCSDYKCIFAKKNRI